MFYEDSYVDGFSVSMEYVMFGVDGDSIWGEVAAGKATRGYVAYELPEDWDEIEFQYKPLFEGKENKLIFIANKSDL